MKRYIISREELGEVSQLTFSKLIAIPQFMCRKHWLLCDTTISKNPDEIEIRCYLCNQND